VTDRPKVGSLGDLGVDLVKSTEAVLGQTVVEAVVEVTVPLDVDHYHSALRQTDRQTDRPDGQLQRDCVRCHVAMYFLRCSQVLVCRRPSLPITARISWLYWYRGLPTSLVSLKFVAALIIPKAMVLVSVSTVA